MYEGKSSLEGKETQKTVILRTFHLILQGVYIGKIGEELVCHVFSILFRHVILATHVDQHSGS